jgi:hypothetical protein
MRLNTPLTFAFALWVYFQTAWALAASSCPPTLSQTISLYLHGNRPWKLAEPASGSRLTRFGQATERGERDFASGFLSWQSYAQAFRDNLVWALSADASPELRMKHHIHRGPFFTLMDQAGYRGRASKSSEPQSVPQLQDFLRAYFGRIQQHVASGIVREDQVLLPVRVFRTFPNLEIRVVPYGSEGPRFSGVTLTLVDNATFVQLLAQGYFPMGVTFGQLNSPSKHTPAVHDAAHLAAASDLPLATAALIDSCQDLMQRYSPQRLNEPDIKERLNYVTEYLFELDIPPALQDPRGWMLPPGRAPTPDLTVDEVRRHLTGLQFADPRAYAEQARSFVKRLQVEFQLRENYRSFGGAAADPFFSAHGNYDPTPMSPLQQRINAALANPSPLHLAELQVLLVRFSGLRAHHVITELLTGDVSVGQPRFLERLCGGGFSQGILGGFREQVCP